MRWKPEAVVAMLSNAQFVDLSHEIPLYDPGTLSPLSRRGVLAQPFDGMCTWLSLFQLQGWSSTADFSHLVILEKHQTPMPSMGHQSIILFCFESFEFILVPKNSADLIWKTKAMAPRTARADERRSASGKLNAAFEI